MISDKAIAGLRSRLGGKAIGPNDDGYDAARRVWNGMVDRYPGVIVRCHGVADVIEAVNFARECDLLLAVRCGGHNVAGSAVCDGGVVIDLSPMKDIVVDPTGARTVRAQGGVTWGELDRETQRYGLAAPGGVVSSTGIAGLTLGGGVGWLRRKYGMSCDNLVSVDVVTADGALLTASETENPDLFWGVRGGGGNFGVVTSFEYRLHPVGPEVMFAGVLYPLERARSVVPWWRDFMRQAPDEVSSQAVFWSVPAVDAFPAHTHNAPVVALVAMHCGSLAEGERVLQPLRELGEPLPDDEVLGALIAAAESRPSARTLLPVWHHGGAMRRAAGDTAYGERGAEFLLSIDSTWDDPAETEANIRWTRDLWRDMHRFSSGSLYLNFGGFGEEGDALVRAAYGRETYDRLVALKDKFDPGNLFRVNHNIRPTASAAAPAAVTAK